MTADKKHIFLAGSADTTPFTSLGTRGKPPTFPPRDRERHSDYIKSRLEHAWAQAGQEQEARTAVAVPTRHGTYLEFESAPGCDLKTKSLENLPKGIRLANIRTVAVLAPLDREGAVTATRATVYIPSGQEGFFLEKIRQYAEEEVKPQQPVNPEEEAKPGKAKNKDLIEGIEDIHIALTGALWTDDPSLCPGQEPVVCEVWLMGGDPEVEAGFRNTARDLNIPVQAGALRFPERTVVLVNADRDQLGQLLAASDHLAEFRRAKEAAVFWTESANADQVDWAESLRDRLEVVPEPDVAVSVLDTGANNGHMLLAPLLADADRHSCDPAWGVHDHDKHGTLMCGLAGYGNLQQALEGGGIVHVAHCLESVKILPPNGNNDPELYGYVTSQAASRVEIQAPRRKHVLCLAVTAENGRDYGRPTSWSAALDALAAGQDIGQLAPGAADPGAARAGEDSKRLIIVSAGNVDNPNDWKDYADSNLSRSVHDPAQSWNALAVGAYTEKTFLSDPDMAGCTPVAPSGGLSPFSTTSLIWDGKKWPAKPDILMEGGNVVRDGYGLCAACDDTDLLSTSHEPALRQFDTINATSAAAAQAAWMAARIQTLYPQAWPETVRGLMVHSADWTEPMKAMFLGEGSKTDYAQLLRICGYGVPDLQRAMWCANNSLTLIAQETLQPFDRKEGASGLGTKDMHLHALPWPTDVLQGLGETDVTLRVTLSYFIEPGPGEVGWKDRYRYPSHALRFDLNSPGESREEFEKRLNKAAREDGEKAETSSRSDRWRIGSIGRSRGSIHSDIWTGSAAALAMCNLVGVYPVIGWWRERAWLNCWDRQARYSLIISLHVPELDVDIYTPVAVEVGAMVAITT
ncbi:MAG: S8 family peptidase [Desulfovibrionaceae bacterium]